MVGTSVVADAGSGANPGRTAPRNAATLTVSAIIAVDIDDRKLATAQKLGATHTVNSKESDAVEAIRELTGGFGADVVIEAVSRPETYRQAFYGLGRVSGR